MDAIHACMTWCWGSCMPCLNPAVDAVLNASVEPASDVASAASFAPDLNHPLTAFYLKNSRDDRGRLLSEILAWNDSKLEDEHDYIQRLFPLFEASEFDNTASLMDIEFVLAFQSQQIGPTLKQNFLESFSRMLTFYGFERLSNGSIRKSARFYEKRQWLSSQHNFLRITRILKSLTAVGLLSDAQAFLQALQTLYTSAKPGYESNCNDPCHAEYIPEVTRRFWEAALSYNH